MVCGSAPVGVSLVLYLNFDVTSGPIDGFKVFLDLPFLLPTVKLVLFYWLIEDGQQDLTCDLNLVTDSSSFFKELC